MSSILKQTVLAGLGLLSLSREKAEEITKDLIKRGELAESEESKFIKDLMERAEKDKKVIEEKVEEKVEKILTKMNIPTRKEFESLIEKVDKLSKNR